MAWIKIVTTLPRSAKVMQVAAVLKVDRLKAVGAVMDWFCWLDDQCSDGCTKLTPRQVDEVLGVKRLSDALVSVGWARVGEDGLVYVVDFDQHNGETAKSRAQAARRQERFKGNARSVTDASANALPRVRDIDIYKKQVQESYSTVDTSCGGVAKARPGDAEEVEAYMGSLPAGLGADPVEVQRAAEAFFNELEAVGWVNGKGVPVRDWRAMARSYLMKWMRNLGEQRRAGGKPVVQRSQQKRNYDL